MATKILEKTNGTTNIFKNDIKAVPIIFCFNANSGNKIPNNTPVIIPMITKVFVVKYFDILFNFNPFKYNI